jgi:hypothetical protein
MNTMTTSRRLSAYEQLMRQAPAQGREMQADLLCRGCPHHRPHWAYRFCVHTECPYMKGMKTFREEAYEDGT